MFVRKKVNIRTRFFTATFVTPFIHSSLHYTSTTVLLTYYGTTPDVPWQNTDDNRPPVRVLLRHSRIPINWESVERFCTFDWQSIPAWFPNKTVSYCGPWIRSHRATTKWHPFFGSFPRDGASRGVSKGIGGVVLLLRRSRYLEWFHSWLWLWLFRLLL